MKRYLILFTMMVWLVACNSTRQETTYGLKPHVVITAPRNESRIEVGETVTIEYTAADVKGISHLEMSLNGQPLPSQKVTPIVTSYVAKYIWRPEGVGEFVFQLRAFNRDNNSSDPIQITIIVAENGTSEAEKSQILSNEVADSLEKLTKDGTVVIMSTPLPQPDKISTVRLVAPPISQTDSSVVSNSTVLPPTAGLATVTFEAVFVRGAPTRHGSVLGKMARGETAQITGRDRFGGWWQIVYPSNSNTRGWIASGAPFTTATNAFNVPIVE